MTALVFAGALRPGEARAQAGFTKVASGPVVTDRGWYYGCAWGDYDGDGFVDLAVSAQFGGRNRLYRNNWDGSFSAITNQPMTQDVAGSTGMCWGDYDNDGRLDLFIANQETTSGNRRDYLYHNLGQGDFAKVTTGPVVTDSGLGWDAAWVDYDRDGWLDLSVANTGDQGEFLYRNDGQGGFTRITTGPLVTGGRHSIGCAWGDYDGDGDPDFVVANSNYGDGVSANDFLFRNEGNGAFTRQTTGPVVNDFASAGSPSWADFDNDGDLDLFVTSFGGENDRLYRNVGNGEFVLVGGEAPSNDRQSNTGAAWGDYDNDGWLDLYVTGNQGSPARLYHNRGDGRFDLVTTGTVAADGGQSLACAWADYDNDGWLDLFVANAGGLNGPAGPAVTNYLYHNDGGTRNWLHVRLVGGVSNRSAIGAKVRLQATVGGSSFWQLREVANGSGHGKNDLRAHFGLGDATSVETLRIEWPSGMVQEFRGLASRQILTIVEPPVLTASGPGQVQVHGARDLDYAISASPDLRDWTRVGVVKGGGEFVDAEAASRPVRYYRAVVE